MADQSPIEWTDATWTPIRARHRITGKVGWHCEHASPGCANCYSESFNEVRLGTGLPFKPLRWKRSRRIFVCSMTDLFGDWVPDAWIDRVFAVMALCPQHTFQVLTKRSARMRAYLSAARAHPVGMKAMGIALDAHASDSRSMIGAGVKIKGDIAHLAVWPLPNVWLGVSAEDQRRADERRDDLSALAAKGWTTFVSYEPALGPVDWAGWEFLALAISGGQNGPRPSHPDWHRATRDFCAEHSIAYLFKQWGSFIPVLDRERDDPDWGADYCREFADAGRHRWLNLAGGCGFHGERFHVMRKVGKKAAGRLLDGIEHNGMPGGAA